MRPEAPELKSNNLLDKESIHARWQWFCEVKRSLSLASMNALLRLGRFLDHHGGEFPPPAVLNPLLEAEQAHLRRPRAAIDAADEIALGWLQKFKTRIIW